MKQLLILICLIIPSVQAQEYSWLDARVSEIKNIDVHHSNFDDLHVIKEAIGEANVVFLGEHTHGEGNEFEAKARLVRFLHEEMGFDILAFESGLYDLWKADREIKNGVSVKEAFNNSVFNIWTASQQFQPLVKYLEQHKEAFEFVGFDNQFSSSYSQDLVEELNNFLKDNNDEIEERDVDYLKELIDGLSESEVPNNFDAIKFNSIYERLSRKLEGVKAPAQVRERNFWQQNLKSMARLIPALKIYAHKTEETFQAKDSNIRDTQMADNLIFLRKMYPNKKIICWGATPHFINRPSVLENEELQEYHPMGEHIKSELGDDNVFILGFVTSAGTYGAAYEDELEIPTPKADALEFYLHKTDYEYAFINLKNLKTKEAWTTSAIEHESIKGKWQAVADGFFYIKKVTKSTMVGEGNAIPHIEKSTENYVTVTGKITDMKTKEVLPYVHVFVEHTSIGVVSNEQGAFEIKMPAKYKSSTLVFSTISYRTEKRKVVELKSNTSIQMLQTEKLLDEVVVSAKLTTAKDLVLKASKALKNNYTQEPFNYTMYYRGSEFDSLSMTEKGYEAAFEAYYEHGYSPKSAHHFNVLNKRSTTSRASKRHKFTMPWPFLGLDTDYALEQRRYLNRKLLDAYEFKIGDIITTDSSLIYEVSFKASKTRAKYVGFGSVKTFKGKIYIQDTDFAVVKLIENYIFNAQDKKSTQRESFCFNTSYRKYGAYYFASYSVLNSIHSLPREEATPPHLVKGKHELLIVNVNTKNPQPFTNSVWDINKAPYDKSFWERFNTIKK